MTSGIHLSVVSHGHGRLVSALLNDLREHCEQEDLRVSLTVNDGSPLGVDPAAFPFPVEVVVNSGPRGFSTNHNAAFARWSRLPYFCVVNPDIRLHANPFAALRRAVGEEPRLGVVAPLVEGPDGRLEDSARRLPTPWSVIGKALGVGWGPQYRFERRRQVVDWLAGMFMFFPSSVFTRLNGFDERYFLYYEDVNICCRLQLAGYVAVVEPAVRVVHDARRASHRNPKHLYWHLASMLRFFTSPLFARCWWRLRWRRVEAASRSRPDDDWSGRPGERL